MNVQEDETSGGQHDPDRDELGERRARRDPIGDPILIRRAETAEATAHELESRLEGIQTRLRQAEQDSEGASLRLAERERELQRASERLGEGEQQLHLISTRLADRERELHTVSQRLGERERELQAVSQRLAEREQQLHRAELEIRGRVEALEQRVGEVQADLTRERAARQEAERELQELTAAQAAVRPLIGELRQIAQRLRAAAELQESPRAPAAPAGSQTSAAKAPDADPQASTPAPEPARAGDLPETTNAQMAEALAAAVQRLRARVAAVGELQEAPEQPEAPKPAGAGAPDTPPAGGDEPTAGVSSDESRASAPDEEPPADIAKQEPPAGAPYKPPPAVERSEPRAWLAPAIRRVAERRDARLASQLVLELLPAQALAVEKPTRYIVKIAELGAYEISLERGRGSVRDLAGAGLAAERTVLLEGHASAFAELAGGGRKLSAWRPPLGLHVRGGRRRAKPLLASRRRPLALSELEGAGVTVWPGLLLLALAEAIDPSATVGYAFTVAFAIEGQQSAVMHVQSLLGKPLAVTRAEAQSGEQAPSQAAPDVTVRLSERGFARLITAQDLGDETVLLEGDRAALETLLSWTDRVQGIRRFGA